MFFPKPGVLYKVTGISKQISPLFGLFLRDDNLLALFAPQLR